MILICVPYRGDYMTSGIYKITCIANNDYYYGSAQIFEVRCRDHINALRRGKHFNSRVQRVWNKYGELNFRMELIEAVSIDLLLEVEDKYLKEHVGKPHCMNIAKYAEAPFRGRTHSMETRERLSQTGRGNRGRTGIPLSIKHKHAISNFQKGKPKPNEQRRKMCEAWKTRPPITEETRRKIGDASRGRRHSEETKQQMSQSHKNMSDETKRKIGDAQRGKKRTAETCRKISESKIGKKGHPNSLELRRKLGDAARRRKGTKSPKTSMTLKKLYVEHPEKAIRSSWFKPGKLHPDYGKKPPAEQIQRQIDTCRKTGVYEKFSKAHSKSIYHVSETDEIIKKYDSIKEAANDLNIPRRNISHVLLGNQVQTRGHRFRYA